MPRVPSTPSRKVWLSAARHPQEHAASEGRRYGQRGLLYPDQVVTCFAAYLEHEKRTISRAEPWGASQTQQFPPHI